MVMQNGRITTLVKFHIAHEKMMSSDACHQG
jgi:hypothetical protein